MPPGKKPMPGKKPDAIITEKSPRESGAGGGRRDTEYLCVNAECKLRKKGCRGFEGCPGFKGR